MSDYEINLSLPPATYQSLSEIATASGWTLEDVVLRTLKAGMPPSLRKVPQEAHAELLGLNGQNDEQLWQVIQGHYKPKKKITLASGEALDVSSLARAYAFSLLKWRGHPMPPPEFLID